ncbi:MAG: hypothetical protein ACO3JL_06160 [Myxococcota bacterium]
MKPPLLNEESGGWCIWQRQLRVEQKHHHGVLLQLREQPPGGMDDR